MCSALAAVYGIAALQGNPAAAKSCASARALTPKLAPLTRGEVAAVAAAKDPRPAPALAFQDAQGTARQVEDFRGRTILLNLWATWCAPCRQEMPALDELQAKLGGPDFEVVTINIDTRDPEKAKAWWRDAGIRHLTYYTDHSAKVFQELKAAGKAFGMPTTLLIDAQGCELATLAGPAEWASPEAIRLIEAALGRGS
jgi:thiol-disulfide isomerase/thioredoxin